MIYTLNDYRQMLNGRRCPECGKLLDPKWLGYFEQAQYGHQVSEFAGPLTLFFDCWRCGAQIPLFDLGITSSGELRPEIVYDLAEGVADSLCLYCDICNEELSPPWGTTAESKPGEL